LAALSFPGNAKDMPGSQSTGRAGLSCLKGAFSLDGIMKMLGDFFTVGLALVTLQVMSRK
jgi:hypothetical protein